MQTKILLAEDDETLGFLLTEFLLSRNFEVHWAKDGVEALRMFNEDRYDLCLLDVMMPALDGLTVAELLRNRRPDLPVIFLTAKSLHTDVVKGFRAGADDYIIKPVNEEELVARIHAVLKRTGAEVTAAGPGNHTVYQIGDYIFNGEKRYLQFENDRMDLTEMESRLLKTLCEKKGHLVSREVVLEKIWGRQDFLARKSMDVFISRLRKYLSKDERIRIVNVHGSGFVLEAP